MIRILKNLSHLVTIALLCLIVWGVVNYFMNKPAPPPTVKDAPWAIQTFSNDGLKIPSRIYFAKDVRIKDDGTSVATTYWTYDGKKYQKYSGEFAFTKREFGDIDIVRRVK